jgi:hypothetical protein
MSIPYFEGLLPGNVILLRDSLVSSSLIYHNLVESPVEISTDRRRSVPSPTVLILTGDAAESLEVMYPYQRHKEEGYDVQIAAPSKKKLHFVVHDF